MVAAYCSGKYIFFTNNKITINPYITADKMNTVTCNKIGINSQCIFKDPKIYKYIDEITIILYLQAKT